MSLISFETDFFTCQIGSLELNRHGKEIRSFTCHKSNAFSKRQCTVKHIYLVTADSDNRNIKGGHSFATPARFRMSRANRKAQTDKNTCTLTFAHMETHTGTYKRPFDVWIGLMKPSAKFIAFDGRLSYGLLRALYPLSLSVVDKISVYSGSYYVEFSINPGKSSENGFDFSTEKEDLFHEPASTLVSKWSSLYSSIGPTE